jgi:hypothetical protein
MCTIGKQHSYCKQSDNNQCGLHYHICIDEHTGQQCCLLTIQRRMMRRCPNNCQQSKMNYQCQCEMRIETTTTTVAPCDLTQTLCNLQCEILF